MVSMTPEQIKALNRAIAEYCGIVPDGAFTPSYTSDLNAIVAVLNDWFVANRMRADLKEVFDYLKYFTIFTHDNPALALCLAFAQAAGLKGWEE